MVAKRVILPLPILLGLIVLGLLIAKLPGVTGLFTPFDCVSCTIGAPLITWLGGGYFAGLITLIALAPRFFSRPVASVGILFAIAMGTFFLWFSPTFCIICFTSHLLHVAMWGYFLVFPKTGMPWDAALLRICIRAVQVGLVVALGFALFDQALFKAGEKKITEAPIFSFKSLDGETIISNNIEPYRYIVLQFVLPKCKYCKIQLPKLNEIQEKLKAKKVGFFNIVERRNKESDDRLRVELFEYAPDIPVVVDDDYKLGQLFNIRTFPSLIVLNHEGRVVLTLIGSSSRLEAELNKVLQ